MQIEKEQLSEFDIYLNDIARFPRLSDEETNRLILLAQKGDEAAARKISESHLKLVVYMSKAFLGYHSYLDRMDLIQAGNLSLFRAIQKYRPGKLKFSNYACWWIKTAMQRAIPKYEFHLQLNEEIDGNDIGNPTKLAIAGEDQERFVQFLKRAANSLSPRDKKILFLHFGFLGEEPKNLEQIGKICALSRERIRVLLDRALIKISSIYKKYSAN